MRKLETKEWIAIVISVFVVGFFFVFGQILVSLFNPSQVKEQEKMTSEPKVLIQDTIAGEGETANKGDLLSVHYTGYFTDGKVFDSSVSRGQVFKFVLGAGQVIKGWDEGFEGMRVGGKRLLSVPPEFGYGPNDYGPIPGNSTLLFEVELLDIQK